LIANSPSSSDRLWEDWERSRTKLGSSTSGGQATPSQGPLCRSKIRQWRPTLTRLREKSIVASLT
jgi:hypothetical protein